MTKPKTNTQAKITPKRIMGNFFFIESHSFIKLRFLIFKLAGGERFVKTVCGRQVHRG